MAVAKLVLFAVPVLGFLIWQWISVSRDLDEDTDDET